MAKLENGRCGLCCTLLVRLSPEDIKTIEGEGFSKEHFVQPGKNGERLLRQINGYCRFLRLEDGIATCTIYEHRPRVCRDYVCVMPGEESCGLLRHYSVIELNKIKGERR
jgi:Fe-S-cluster containining protein